MDLGEDVTRLGLLCGACPGYAFPPLSGREPRRSEAACVDRKSAMCIVGLDRVLAREKWGMLLSVQPVDASLLMRAESLRLLSPRIWVKAYSGWGCA